MAKKLRDTKQAGKLVADLSHLAHIYVSSNRPTIEDLKKLRVLKEIRKNKNIVILKAEKGNGVVFLDRSDYDQGILKIINDTSKFRPIKEDPTLLREGRLQRLLRKFKKDGHLCRGGIGPINRILDNRRSADQGTLLVYRKLR